MGFDGRSTDNNFYHIEVIPNSHFWSDLGQIVTLYNQSPETLTRDYLLTGFQNSLKQGYSIRQDVAVDMNPRHFIVFNSVESLIEYVSRPTFDIKWLIEIIATTINIGMNLVPYPTIQKKFMINVEAIREEDIDEYVKNVAARYKTSVPFSTNDMNIMSIDEDIFIPISKIKMERKEIYNRIDGERDYQDSAWSTRRQENGTPDEDKPVAEWINYMEFHILKAKNAVYYLDTNAALAELRKVTALGVRAMEIHGCPERIVQSEPKSCCSDDCTCKTNNQNDGCCGVTEEK